MIKFKQVSKIFRVNGEKIKAVDEVNLEIERGEIFGIIGYSGAGKSTLLRLVNELEEPTEGEITVEGQQMTSLSPTELRKVRQKIGMIFQHFNLLWSRTVYENIAFPLEIVGLKKAEIDEKVQALLELVNLTDRAHAYPSELSGGQKQRVGIARALANDPYVLLCDEATSALDTETTQEVLDLLVDINQKLGITILLITHELPVVRQICDRVAVMSQGKVVEVKSNPEIFISPESDITKRLLHREAGLENQDMATALSELTSQYPNHSIYELRFTKDSANQPLVSEVSKRCEVDINIIQGSLHSVKGRSIGSLYVQILGEDINILRAIQEFRQEGITIEVIHDA